MPQLESADRLKTGQRLYLDVAGGLHLGTVRDVHPSSDTVQVTFVVAIRRGQAVWIDSDPFEGLVGEAGG